MKTAFSSAVLLVMLTASLFGQNINNTLGSGGTFAIKDASSTLVSVSQSTGNLVLSNGFVLPAIVEGTTGGAVYLGTERFLHNFRASGTDGSNLFIGRNSGNFTMSGSQSYHASYNVSVGHASLGLLTSGFFNVAFGQAALGKNTTGDHNAALGPETLFNNTTGSGNTGMGVQSLYGNNGDNNTAVGYGAGTGLYTGSNNILLGYLSEPSSSSVSNEITLGNSSTATLRCQQTTITGLSDARDKKNIADLVIGLAFIMNLKPRQFNWDQRDWYSGEQDGSMMKPDLTAGFIAQELDEAQTKANVEWLNLVLKSNPEKLEATPGNLLPVMVKAIQELKMENDALRRELEESKVNVKELIRQEVRKVVLETDNSGVETTKVSLNEN